MQTLETINVGRVYHAGPVDPETEIDKNLEAERLAGEQGDAAEVARCRLRRQNIMATRTKSSGKKRLALRRANGRDPLARVSQTLRRAGEILREHQSCVPIGGGLPDVTAGVQGGHEQCYEDFIDRRREGNLAWDRALGGIRDDDFREPTRRVITHRISLSRSAEMAKGYADAKTEAQAKRSLTEALEAAAYFFRINEGEGLDEGQEPADEEAQSEAVAA